LRDVVQADPKTGTVVSRENFNQTLLLDRVVLTGVAIHEGQLFGVANQMLGLLTAFGLITLCLSAVVLWWRRRHVGVLGAPVPMERPRCSFTLVAAVLALAVYLPELGLSLVLTFLVERFILSRIPSARRWLGLAHSSS
jgi:uncharacterized iron-regulated membrane protein